MIDKIKEVTLLNATDETSDPYDYHLEKCGADSFKSMERFPLHTCWLGFDVENVSDEEVENVDLVEDVFVTNFRNGDHEMVKNFQICVICYNNDSIYDFRNCGHLCICERCCPKKVILI